MLQDQILRTILCGCSSILYFFWLGRASLINIISKKCFVPLRYQQTTGTWAGLTLQFFFIMDKVGRANLLVSVSVNGSAGEAIDILQTDGSGEDPMATGGLVSNLPHPRVNFFLSVNKTKSHTDVSGEGFCC